MRACVRACERARFKLTFFNLFFKLISVSWISILFSPETGKKETNVYFSLFVFRFFFLSLCKTQRYCQRSVISWFIFSIIRLHVRKHLHGRLHVSSSVFLKLINCDCTLVASLDVLNVRVVWSYFAFIYLATSAT